MYNNVSGLNNSFSIPFNQFWDSFLELTGSQLLLFGIDPKEDDLISTLPGYMSKGEGHGSFSGFK